MSVSPENYPNATVSSVLGDLSIMLCRQEDAWRSGESLPIELLESSLPKDENGEEQLLCLICNEVYLREQRGEKPKLDEYQKRFPHIASALRVQWAVDELLDCHRSGVSETQQLLANTPSSRRPNGNSGRVGCLLGTRYELEQEIGNGGMGVVYLANDRKLGRAVAVKMLHAPTIQRQETLTRFRSEAELLARAVHPNIVPVFDVGESEGEPFIVMEYCDAGSLSDYLRGIPVEWRGAAEWIQRIAKGVSAAHAMGVAHRDLKPSNILLSRTLTPDTARGERKKFELTDLEQLTAKVTDFGLAKHVDASANLTATGDTIGTPAYMAPEQLSAKEGIDPKLSDVYSLGAILYECLTGRPPVRGASTFETIELLRTQDPVSIRQLQPLVPVDLSVITHKCLQREPLQRYATVDDLIDDLKRFVDGRPILAKPSPAWRKAWKWARRRPAVAATLVTAFGALTSLLVGWAIFTKEIQIAKDSAERERDTARTQTKRAERNATWAMEAVDKLIAQVGDKGLASIPQMDQTRKDLLQTAVAFCLKFAEDRENPDPDARNQVALAYRRLAKIHRALGETQPWKESLENATAIHRKLVDEFPNNDEYLTELSKTLNNLANAPYGIEKFISILEESIAIKMELVLRHPKSADHRASLATSLASIGGKYRTVKPEKAEGAFLQSDELLRGLITEFPGILHIEMPQGSYFRIGHLIGQKWGVMRKRSKVRYH